MADAWRAMVDKVKAEANTVAETAIKQQLWDIIAAVVTEETAVPLLTQDVALSASGDGDDEGATGSWEWPARDAEPLLEELDALCTLRGWIREATAEYEDAFSKWSRLEKIARRHCDCHCGRGWLCVHHRPSSVPPAWLCVDLRAVKLPQ